MAPQCTEWASQFYVQCSRMTSNLPEPTPRWGWLLIAAGALAAIVCVDLILTITRKTRT